MDYFDGGTYHTGASGASSTFAVGDYIGIHRIDATHYQCFKATAAAPTTWTAATGVEVINTQSSNGSPGIYSDAAATNNILAGDAFESGVGALPTTHNCAS